VISANYQVNTVLESRHLHGLDGPDLNTLHAADTAAGKPGGADEATCAATFRYVKQLTSGWLRDVVHDGDEQVIAAVPPSVVVL